MEYIWSVSYTHLDVYKRQVLCIEPMITLGTHRVRVLGDDWTAVTIDGKPAAHFEHTVVVTENGPEILTMREEPRLIK